MIPGGHLRVYRLATERGKDVEAEESGIRVCWTRLREVKQVLLWAEEGESIRANIDRPGGGSEANTESIERSP